MKLLFATVIILASSKISAQHFYKDIIGTKETAATLRGYVQNKVSRVLLSTYNANNTRDEDFSVDQQFAKGELRTITRSDLNNQSTLISYTDGDSRVIKTIDSSAVVVTTTNYKYNPLGQLLSMNSFSSDSAKTTTQREEHLWQYIDEKPVKMLRIKNSTDTAFVNFKLDENGNVIEEAEVRKGIAAEPVYYYYDSKNRLTDIVRYNRKAKKLLPEYMFEYSPAGQVIQKITVPSNNDNYLIWRYQYNSQGLKIKEVIYNKQKELAGKIEYQYSFGG